ncbi:MAG: hypothetical protein HFJ50_02390 [Clostridia bacterium]|nr:hypothetical protein [Clostridia bacterium]
MGKETEIPIKEITIGDTVLLSAGSMIPADLRIIEAKDLYVRTIFVNPVNQIVSKKLLKLS